MSSDYSNKIIFMIDGAFAKKRIMQTGIFFYDGPNIRSYCMKHLGIGDKLIHMYYYDAVPYMGVGEHPITGPINFATTPLVEKQNKFLRSLVNTKDLITRLGSSTWTAGEWMINNNRIGELVAGELNGMDIQPKDIYPNIRQKGVSVLMGIDAALIAYQRMADSVIIIGNDMELAPITEVLRKYGIKVYLDPLWTKASEPLRAAVDAIVNIGERPKKEINGHVVPSFDDIKDIRNNKPEIPYNPYRRHETVTND